MRVIRTVNQTVSQRYLRESVIRESVVNRSWTIRRSSVTAFHPRLESAIAESRVYNKSCVIPVNQSASNSSCVFYSFISITASVYDYVYETTPELWLCIVSCVLELESHVRIEQCIYIVVDCHCLLNCFDYWNRYFGSFDIFGFRDLTYLATKTSNNYTPSSLVFCVRNKLGARPGAKPKTIRVWISKFWYCVVETAKV